MRHLFRRIRTRGPHGVVLVALSAATLGIAASASAAQQAAPYADVAANSPHSEAINTLAAEGVFVGTECDEGFCPDDVIDRATAAVWVVRARDGDDPEPVSATRFGDVDAAHPHAAFIERLAELDVTSGCGDRLLPRRRDNPRPHGRVPIAGLRSG